MVFRKRGKPPWLHTQKYEILRNYHTTLVLLFICAFADTPLSERTETLLMALLRELETEERQVTGKSIPCCVPVSFQSC